MGVCSTKQEKKINKFPVERLFPVTETKTNETESAKSEFYYFVEWMISFNFYKRLRNSLECPTISILNDDPKKSSIFKLIKAIDCSFVREKINSFFTVSDSTQPKQSNDIEKDQLRSIFAHLAKINMPKLKKLLTDGPPNNMRWFIWMTLAKLSYEAVEAKLNIDNRRIFKVLFSSSFDAIRDSISKEQTAINSHELFNRNFNYQSCLLNVITAIVTYDKKISSSDVINSIVGNALIVSDFNEEESFYLVRYIYSSEYGINLRELINNGAPKLIYYSFIVNKLIESRCPKIYTYFLKTNISKVNWVNQWIQSLYTFLDISSAIRLWDCVFAVGCDFLIYFSLGCIKFCENDIIEAQVNEYSQLNEVIKANLNAEKAIKFALDFHIGKYTQIKFDQEFFYNIIKYEDAKENENVQNGEESSVIENNDDLYQEKISKIKVIFHKHFNKEDKGIAKLSSEQKKEKMTAIKKLKEIYFKDSSIDQAETQMLCTLSNKCYLEYLKEKDEDQQLQLKVKMNSTNSNIKKTKSQHISHHVRFTSKASQNEFPSGIALKKNYSLIELNNEDSDSSNLSSLNKYHNYSIINQIDGADDILKKNGEGSNDRELNDNCNKDQESVNNSIITPEDYDEDSLDEEAMIKMMEDKGMDSFLKENAPKKIVKVNP